MGTSCSKPQTETQKQCASFTDYNKRDLTVYHATTATNATSIIKTGFRIPEAHEGPERGLKAGAAAYFGFNKEYSIQEAVTSLEKLERANKLPRRQRSVIRESVVCLKVTLNLNRTLVFADYDNGSKGRGIWPIHECKKLPSGNTYSGKTLTASQWDEETERLNKDYLQQHGYDSVVLKFSDDIQIQRNVDCTVIAVYDRKSVKNITMI